METGELLEYKQKREKNDYGKKGIVEKKRVVKKRYRIENGRRWLRGRQRW